MKLNWHLAPAAKIKLMKQHWPFILIGNFARFARVIFDELPIGIHT